MSKFKKSFLAGSMLIAFAGAAVAAVWTMNLPRVGPGTTSLSSGQSVTNYPYVTGYETVPVDTQLAQGAQPQSVAPTTAQVAMIAAAMGSHTGTTSSGAVTLNTSLGELTTESLTTAANATYTITLTDSMVTATSVVQALAFLGTSTQGQPTITSITPASGSVVIIIKNTGTSAFNGTLNVPFQILWPSNAN